MERYEKLRVIGQGAFGKVFLVKRLTDSRQVVIKQIPVEDLGKEERFSALNEVKVLSMLQHPNIIGYFDNFVAEKSLMIVMEYAPGGTLHEFIQERNSQLLDEDLLVAIEHVHLLNILHRDLKTQNVMMNRKRNILKIGDFGISKVLSSKITSAQTLVGTPCYISPEICEGKMYATKSDMWALGCILYELTTLRKAFEGPNLPALVLKIMQANSALEPIDPTYSKALKDLIYSLLQRQPDDRPDVHQVMATPLLINAHVNLTTDVGRLPCTKVNPETNMPITCTRMNSMGELSQRSYAVEEYTPPGGVGVADKAPQPVVYLWGGSVTVPMRLEAPMALTDAKMTSVTCGRTQKAGVTEDGKLIFWELSAGSLGTTRLTLAPTGAGPGARGRPLKRDPVVFDPILIGGLKTTTIKKVACGDMFTACLTDRGILMTFGNGANGSLGHGDYNDVKEPRLVHEMLEFETTEVACGNYHVVAITSEGSVYAWGRGDRGQLGLGECNQSPTPERVWLPPETVPLLVCCGSDCSIIVTNSGQLLATGVNKSNKLSLDKKPESEPEASPQPDQSSQTGPVEAAAARTGPEVEEDDSTPAILKLLKSQARMGQSFFIASMQPDTQTRGSGSSLVGGATSGGGEGRGSASEVAPPIGTGMLTTSLGSRPSKRPKWVVNQVTEFTPARCELVKERNIVSVAVGINHVALLTASGEILTSGDNSYGQLGYRRDHAPGTADHTSFSDRLPQVVTALSDMEVTKIACGDFFCIASCKDGTMYSWGRGRGGRLGMDIVEDVFEPREIPFEFPSHQVQSLSCRHGVTMMLTVPQQS